tara:strand:+ start:388 stop:594 length:207 start_codon:yes stop_codon:yes gene_type:complete
MKEQMLDALTLDAEAKINLAKMNVWILLNNPVGVGEHPNVMETIQEQLDIISKHKDRISTLMDISNED